MDNINQSKKIILEKAFESFTREGPRNFTVECLATNLGMSKKTIYKYFPSKEILIDKFFEFFTDSFRRKFEEVARSNENPIEKFNIIVDYLSKKILYIPSSNLVEVKMRHPNIWKKIEKFRLEMTQYFGKIFKEAQQQGLAKPDIDMEKTAILFMNIINSTFQPEFFINNNLAPADALKLFMKIISEGIFVEQIDKKRNHNKLIWEN